MTDRDTSMIIADHHPELEQAHRYVTRELDPASATAFEDHMVGCERCQAEVRLAAALRQVVRETPTPSSRSRARWVIGASSLLAAALIAFVVLERGPDRAITALGQITDPPAYVGITVRSAPNRGGALFNAAMAEYHAGHYSDAASQLRAALAAGVDSVPAEFFAASADLMAGHPGQAEQGYARVIAAGPAAAGYLSDAHLYRARALLQLGRASDALSELALVRSDDVNGAQAASLAASVTRALGR